MMRTFFYNIFLFFIFVTTISFIAGVIIQFPIKGNDHFETKYNYLIKNKERYNTVFLGSSRIYRQVIPEIYDSLMGDSKNLSFNLATPATFAPEQFFLLERLIEQNSNLKTIFIELQPINNIGMQNLFAVRSFYWMNWKGLKLAFNYFYSSKLNSFEKFQAISKYGLAYIYKFYAGKFALFLNRNSSYKEILGPNKDGYLSLDEQYLTTNIEKKKLLESHEELFKDTSKLGVRRKIAMNAVTNPVEYINKPYYYYLNSINETCKKRGVNLIFIIPPRLNNYDEIYGKNMPKNLKIINLFSPVKYSSFYSVKNSFDIGHLNYMGAKEFTKALVKEYKLNIINN